MRYDRKDNIYRKEKEIIMNEFEMLLESIYEAIDQGDYENWITPIIKFSESRNESAAGYIALALDRYFEKESLKLEGV